MSYVKFLSKFSNRQLTGVEIGVYEGDNAVRMCSNMNNLSRLYVVDPYLKYAEYTSYSGHTQEEWKNIEARARKKLVDDGSDSGVCHGTSVTFMTMTSEEAAAEFADNSIDFVYIDGNHAYEYVLQDIKLWQPKVKSGGFIMGHDWPYPSVQKAVNEYISEHGIELHPQSGFKHGYHDWWFTKE